MELTGIVVYPIKSCRGIAVPARAVERRGLAGDRRWMLVDHEGRFVTQREEPRLAPVRVAFDADGYAVSAPGRAGIRGSAPYRPWSSDRGHDLEVHV